MLNSPTGYLMWSPGVEYAMQRFWIHLCFSAFSKLWILILIIMKMEDNLLSCIFTLFKIIIFEIIKNTFAKVKLYSKDLKLFFKKEHKNCMLLIRWE